MTSSELIAELQRYRKELRRIMDRFERGSESFTIATEDAPIYKQVYLEICDLFTDVFGRPNPYTVQVANLYREGLDNWLSSPNYNSIESIDAVLGSVMTRVNRSPEILQAGLGNKKDNVNLSSKRVFIGHGHSTAWRDIKDFLRDRCGLEHEEFNRESPAGKSNKQRLEEMLDDSGFALIIMTAEDETKDRTLRARENVVHEAGLFQGRLGFERAIILREEGCEEFSNIEGLVQIPFPKGNVMAVSEKIREVLEREGLIPKSGS